MRLPDPSPGLVIGPPAGPSRTTWCGFSPRSWARAGLLATAVLASYAPALRGGFLWDDNGHVTTAALRSWSGLARIWTEPGATQQYYPPLHTAFWLEHRLWGDAVLGYHLANLAQHLLAVGLLALVLRRLAVPGAMLAAAIFALHPVHVESVAWISEQKNTLSLVFYLGAALAYLRFVDEGRRRNYWFGCALFGCALLTKTVTATLPAALLVVRWWKTGRLTWRGDVGPLVPWLLVGAMAGLFTAAVERDLIGADGTGYALSAAGRVVLAGRAIWFYAGNFLWPANLTFIYPRWTIDAGSIAQWLPMAGAAVVTVTLWAWRGRSRAPLAAWLLFVGSLFPALGFFNVYSFQYSFAADHFQYLPDVTLAGAAGAALAMLTRAWRPAWRVAGGGALAALLAGLTLRQAPDYRGSEALYRATLARNPDCWMAHNNLGLIVSARGQRDEALGHFRRAIALKPDYFDGHNNLGLTLTQAARPEAALPHLEAAVRLRPSAAQARNNLGIALAALRRTQEAVAAFRGAARFMPDSPNVQENLAKALRLAGRDAEAAAAATQAERLRGGK